MILDIGRIYEWLFPGKIPRLYLQYLFREIQVYNFLLKLPDTASMIEIKAKANSQEAADDRKGERWENFRWEAEMTNMRSKRIRPYSAIRESGS